MSKFITSDIGGGLGNQMFMIAHATAQSWKYNVPAKFILEASGYTGWDTINYKDNIFRNIEFVQSYDYPINFIENRGSTPDLGTELSQSIKFEGYYQSTKNFLGYDKRIQELFSPTVEFIDKIEKLYPQIKSNNTVSVHVRRGDYLRISHILPTVSTSYIDEAIHQNGEYDTLFAFSDDKLWIRNNTKHDNVVIVDGLTAWEELWLMSLCTNNIICNSSFSWWGAFLNKNENKKVFAPSIWTNPNHKIMLYEPYNSIYSPEWNKINVKCENGILIKI